MATEALLSPDSALPFILGGNAVFTLQSCKTGARYTFRVKAPKDRNDRRFVQLLTGPDNTQDYTYVGMIDRDTFKLTKASVLTEDSAPVKAFRWAFDYLTHDTPPPGVQIYHAGRCGRCGRVLTVPESIETGFGPECAGRL